MTAPLAPETGQPAWAVRMESKLDALAVDMEQMRVRVYGNGRPGVLADVAELQREARDLRADFAAREKFIGAVAAAVGMLILGLLWGVFTGQVEILFH